METNVIHLKEVDSTNRWLRDYHVEKPDCLVVCRADHQTAGRGCGQNTWESEQGKNLLFSILIHPDHVMANEQFILSMAEALAVKSVLDRYVDGISLKWPNDIYWHDCKLAGTLIETTLKGNRIERCIFGTGLNVNQKIFISNAPNPISLVQILGHEMDCLQLFNKIVSSMVDYFNKLRDGAWEEIRGQYHNCLYRRNEHHQYRFMDNRIEELVLQRVESDGRLVLISTRDSQELSFGFKEIEFII